MLTLDLGRLSGSEAEAALADVWRQLEEHSIPTPKLVVITLPQDQLAVSLVFGSARDAERVAAGLRGVLQEAQAVARGA